MTPVLLTLLGLILACGATLFALPTVLTGGSATRAWIAAALGVFALVFAELSKTTSLFDLPAIVGVVLVSGIAGAEWSPSGKRKLLVVGLLCFSVMIVARLVAFSHATTGFGGGVITQVVDDISISWATARVAGLAAFLAATGAIVLGARRPARLPLRGLPARLYALHRALGIVALLATVVHLLALWLDDFIEFSWAQLLLVPWTASYEPFGVTLGWLAMLSLVLAAASGALRRLLPGWRILHAASYLTFALGLFHGLIAGTDAGSPATLVFYLAALLAVGWATYRRLFSLSEPSPRHSLKKSSASKASGEESWPIPDTTKRREDHIVRH